MKTAIASATGLAVVGMLVAGCGSGSNADLVTPDQAKQAATSYTNAAQVLQIKQEAGSLRRIDDASLVLNPMMGRATPNPAIQQDWTVWVPHQTEYPISFVGLEKLSANGRQAAQLFRFSKASATASWLATFQAALSSAALAPSVAVDGKGYAERVSSDQYDKLALSPARLAKDFTGYIVAGNSADSSVFAPGAFTTTQIESDTKAQQQAATANPAAKLTLEGAPTDDPVDVYRLRDGGALVLAGVKWTQHKVAVSGPIVLTDDGKGVVGPPPGKYRAYSVVVVDLLAFTVPAKGGDAKVAAIAAYPGPVSSSATPG